MSRSALAWMAASAVLAGSAMAAAAEQPMIGERAPAFRLPDLEESELALEDLRGRFIVLHFGASW